MYYIVGQNLGSPKAQLIQSTSQSNNNSYSHSHSQSKDINKSTLFLGNNITFSNNKNNVYSSDTKIQNEDNQNNFLTSPFRTYKEKENSTNSMESVIPKLPLHSNLMIH